jgi:Flp pilus assembly CpaF family ATPase
MSLSADPRVARANGAGAVLRSLQPPTMAWRFAGLDWSVVRELSAGVGERMVGWRRNTPEGQRATDADQRVYAAKLATEQVREHARAEARRGQTLEEAVLVAAVLAESQGFGRLQPLIDDAGLENIEVYGCDNVTLVYADGRIQDGPRIADSDEQLVDYLQRWAARAGRTISPASPRLHLTLPGRDGQPSARLMATIVTTKRPVAVVRLHRLVDTTLSTMVELGAISDVLANFLHYAVQANANIVITGPANAGKTTLLRALAASIPTYERYATLETEEELHLDLIGRHRRAVAYEERHGSLDQITASGRPAGQVTLSNLIEDALRGNFARIILGEVRGAEVLALLEAISTGGKGTLCTIHANSAREAIERIVSLCLTRTGTTETFAHRLTAQSLHYVVHIDLVESANAHGQIHRRRYITQIIEVCGLNEHGRPLFTDVATPDPATGRAVPTGTLPTRITALERHGFDRTALLRGGDGGWHEPTGQAAR